MAKKKRVVELPDGRVAVDIGHSGRAAIFRKDDGITGTSSDFTGNLEDWERRVFCEAKVFRLHRFYGNGNNDRAETSNFREALTLAAAELQQPGRRVMVYAVAETGRWFQIPQDQWLKYLRIWDVNNASAKTRKS